jgi:hypothetical protein
LLQLRQATLNELQVALEKVQQAKGAIAMLDVLIAQYDLGNQDEVKPGGTD